MKINEQDKIFSVKILLVVVALQLTLTVFLFLKSSSLVETYNSLVVYSLFLALVPGFFGLVLWLGDEDKSYAATPNGEMNVTPNGEMNATSNGEANAYGQTLSLVAISALVVGYNIILKSLNPPIWLALALPFGGSMAILRKAQLRV